VSRRRCRALLLAALLPFALGACSAGLPFAGLTGDAEMTTGSVKPVESSPNSPLAPLLKPQEWAAAAPALGQALDPASHGERAQWSGGKDGPTVAFLPEGPAYVRNDEVCRTFLAEVSLQGGRSTHLGTACRVGAGPWNVQKMKPWPGA
jgi:hypothetical protein